MSLPSNSGAAAPPARIWEVSGRRCEPRLPLFRRRPPPGSFAFFLSCPVNSFFRIADRMSESSTSSRIDSAEGPLLGSSTHPFPFRGPSGACVEFLFLRSVSLWWPILKDGAGNLPFLEAFRQLVGILRYKALLSPS